MTNTNYFVVGNAIILSSLLAVSISMVAIGKQLK